MPGSLARIAAGRRGLLEPRPSANVTGLWLARFAAEGRRLVFALVLVLGRGCTRGRGLTRKPWTMGERRGAGFCRPCRLSGWGFFLRPSTWARGKRRRQSRDAQRGNGETFTLYADAFFARLEKAWSGSWATDGVARALTGAPRTDRTAPRTERRGDERSEREEERTGKDPDGESCFSSPARLLDRRELPSAAGLMISNSQAVRPGLPSPETPLPRERQSPARIATPH